MLLSFADGRCDNVSRFMIVNNVNPDPPVRYLIGEGEPETIQSSYYRVLRIPTEGSASLFDSGDFAWSRADEVKIKIE